MNIPRVPLNLVTVPLRLGISRLKWSLPIRASSYLGFCDWFVWKAEKIGRPAPRKEDRQDPFIKTVTGLCVLSPGSRSPQNTQPLNDQLPTSLCVDEHQESDSP